MNISGRFTCIFCGSKKSKLVFDYKEPPMGETVFTTVGGKYLRKIIQCQICSHMISIENILNDDIYESEYNKSTYADPEGMIRTFRKIIGLDKSDSDNYGRCNRVEALINQVIGNEKNNSLKLLDVGSGLGIFPFEMNKRGFNITALDPDPESISHISKQIMIPTICNEFDHAGIDKKYHFIFFNKVLEHVHDPVKMLKKSLNILVDPGYVYFEVPDGEEAKKFGKDREEFFIEHHHVFSFISSTLLAMHAGFIPIMVERVVEPSTKYTLRVFCKKI